MLYNVVQYYTNVKFEIYVWIYVLFANVLNIFICEFDNFVFFFANI